VALGRANRQALATMGAPDGSPQAFTENIEVRGVKPMLVRKKAKACGVVLYGILLGLVLPLPGCSANWPAPGSKEELKLLGQIPPSHGGGGIGP
jgi:preprotein translocase subunit Sec63